MYTHTYTLSSGLPVRDPQKGKRGGRRRQQRGKRCHRHDDSEDSEEEWQPWKEVQQTRKKPQGRGVCERVLSDYV